MTDFRALCAELVNTTGTDFLAALDQARAALSQPEPEGPTLDDIDDLCAEHSFFCCGEEDLALLRMVIDSAFARWGRSTPQPIPVSERLPGPRDCDAEGRCWLLTVDDDYPQWRLHSIQGAQPGGAMIWVPVDSSPGVMVDCFYTSHWLPAHALPVPTHTSENDFDV